MLRRVPCHKRCASFTHWLSPKMAGCVSGSGTSTLRLNIAETAPPAFQVTTLAADAAAVATNARANTLPNLLRAPAGWCTCRVRCCVWPPTRPHASLQCARARGTRFNQAHALATESAPSRCALLSGRFMHSNAHRTTGHLLQSWESNVLVTCAVPATSSRGLGKTMPSAPKRSSSVSTIGRAPTPVPTPSRRRPSPCADTRALCRFCTCHRRVGAVHRRIWRQRLRSRPAGLLLVFQQRLGHQFRSAGAQAPLRPARLINKPRYHNRIPALRVWMTPRFWAAIL